MINQVYSNDWAEILEDIMQQEHEQEIEIVETPPTLYHISSYNPEAETYDFPY
jgi:hypothetical protein